MGIRGMITGTALLLALFLPVALGTPGCIDLVTPYSRKSPITFSLSSAHARILSFRGAEHMYPVDGMCGACFLQCYSSWLFVY